MSKLQDIIEYGVIASRPAAGTPGRLYGSSDESPPTLYRDNGSSWDQVADLGGGSSSSTILARYTRTTNQSIGNASATIVDYATNVRDTNSAVTTGASWHFTAPSTLDYVVLAAITFDTTGTWNDGDACELMIYKNGSVYSTISFAWNNGGASYLSARGSDTVHLTAGDTIDIRIYQSSGGSLNILGSGQYSYVNIYSLP